MAWMESRARARTKEYCFDVPLPPLVFSGRINPMHCLLGCLALLTPRVVLALVWIFSGYIGRAYQGILWPLLGFLFMPLTTLAYAYAINSQQSVTGLYLVLVVVAVLLDMGLIGGGEASRRRRRKAA